MNRILLEVCVDDPDGLEAAVAGGADRVELCSALCAGGLTPSPGLMSAAGMPPVPVYAMIRPRAGDFVYDAADLEVMRRDIDAARAAGLAGVVLGASRADGRLDARMLTKLAGHAAGMG
ncbi:copper homeostasis protein CutC, partial [Sinorhizobium medicae]